MRAWWLVLAMGCATEEDELLPIDQGAAPLSFTSTPLVKGAQATMRVTGAQPGQPVFFLRSNATQTAGTCPAPLAPLCLDLAPQATLTRQVNANNAGEASFSFTVPTNLAAGSLAWQAAQISPKQTSNTLILPILPAGTDPGPARVLSLPGDATAGQALYLNFCGACHGADGRGGGGFPNLRDELRNSSRGDIAETMYYGSPPQMPAGSSVYSDQELANVLAYLYDAFAP